MSTNTQSSSHKAYCDEHRASPGERLSAQGDGRHSTDLLVRLESCICLLKPSLPYWTNLLQGCSYTQSRQKIFSSFSATCVLSRLTSTFVRAFVSQLRRLVIVLLCVNMDILDVYADNITGGDELHLLPHVNQYSSCDLRPKITIAGSAIPAKWVIQLTFVLVLAGFLLVKFSFATSTFRSSSQVRAQGFPPTASYSIPIIGHLVSFLYDTAGLAAAIT